MDIQPTGTRAEDGALELLRGLALAPEQLWRYLAEPEDTARWFGPWTWTRQRREVEVILLAEQGSPTERIAILDCDASGHRLSVRAGQGPEAWQLDFSIRPAGSGSQLLLRMPHLDASTAVAAGPGWEFYLDRLAAAANGTDADAVRFEPDYYPALCGYYEQLFGG